jgi:hypothetical protein
VVVRPGELHPHHRRKQPAGGEEAERGDDEAHPDRLVVDRHEPSGDPWRITPGRFQRSTVGIARRHRVDASQLRIGGHQRRLPR